jgi:hypothetical protein
MKVKNTKVVLSLLLLLICTTTLTTAQRMFVQMGSQVEITEVKNMGVSAANETKSIIEIRWQTNFAPNMNVKSFDLKLEVTYTDGAVVTAQSSASGTARSGRVEVPTTHTSLGRPPAAMKSFRASVTTTFTETTTKQFPLRDEG